MYQPRHIFTSLLLFSGLALTLGCNQQKSNTSAETQASAAESQPLAESDHRSKVKTVPTHSAETFFLTTSYGGSSFSFDDSKILVNSDQTGVFNAYAYASDGSSVTQLTDSTTNAIFGISYFPKDNRIIYSSDQGGNELNHLYVLEIDGTVVDLTPGEKVKAQWMGWSGDEKSFWVLTNERDAKGFDLYRYNYVDYERELVFKNVDNFNVDDVSRDGKWVALTKARNNADSDIYLWRADTPNNAPQLITAHEGNINHQVATFTPDSTQLMYSTDEFGEFAQIWSYHLETGERKKEIEESWDVMSVSYSKAGNYRVVSVNEDARTSIRITHTTTGEPLQLPTLPDSDLRSINFSSEESHISFYLDSDTSPANLFVFNRTNQQMKQLTVALNPAIKQEELVAGEVIRYESFDGLNIPAILYRPWPASSENKVPALVWVHGGPGGQSRHGYSATLQHLINHGYAILAVNNRGSSGYGKTFFHLDDRKHGDVDLKDCVYGKKYLQSLDWVDPDQIGIIGGSYGGYMVAAALAFQPEEFDVGIDIFGVTNWSRTLKNIPPWWESIKELLYAEMGDPAEDAERHQAISPLFHADKITKPLLVIQGANDPRVLQAESDELVEAVRKNNVPVEYVLFPDEGHGFRRRENRITASDAYVNFLNKYLKKTAETSP